MVPNVTNQFVLSSKHTARRPSWLLKALSKRRYRWFFLQNFSFRTTAIYEMEDTNRWALYERSNHCTIDFELNSNHHIWQQKLREKDAAYSFLAKGLNDFTLSFTFKFTPKENDKLVINIDGVVNELVYEEGCWYMDNTNSYRNEEWHCWLIWSGEVMR